MIEEVYNNVLREFRENRLKKDIDFKKRRLAEQWIKFFMCGKVEHRARSCNGKREEIILVEKCRLNTRENTKVSANGCDLKRVKSVNRFEQLK